MMVKYSVVKGVELITCQPRQRGRGRGARGPSQPESLPLGRSPAGVGRCAARKRLPAWNQGHPETDWWHNKTGEVKSGHSNWREEVGTGLKWPLNSMWPTSCAQEGFWFFSQAAEYELWARLHNPKHATAHKYTQSLSTVLLHWVAFSFQKDLTSKADIFYIPKESLNTKHKDVITGTHTLSLSTVKSQNQIIHGSKEPF